MAEKDGGGGAGFWTGVLVGGIVGAVAGVLFAPKSGEETRAMIGEKTGEWRDRAEELAESTRDRVHSAMDEGRAAATRARGESLILEDDDYNDPV
jgi:gas vesicle protein